MKKITLFSDGSALGNPGPDGYGVILRFGDKEEELFGSTEHTSNNRMELLGITEGLDVSAQHTIHAIWVRGHDGHEENEHCDVLARDAAQKMKDSL